jgi:hypothetical protein
MPLPGWLFWAGKTPRLLLKPQKKQDFLSFCKQVLVAAGTRLFPFSGKCFAISLSKPQCPWYAISTTPAPLTTAAKVLNMASVQL